MENFTDPSLMSLPHPVRVDVAAGYPVDTALFEHVGIMATLRPYLTDEHATTEWIVNHVPGMHELAVAHFGVLAGGNMGSFMLTVTRARLRAHGDPILQVTPALQAMLAETDLAGGLPARFFRSPYPLVFVEFARPNPLRVPNRLSGLHECEGAYIGTYQLAPHHEVHAFKGRGQALGLDPAKPTRAVEIVIIGSPVGKQHVLDDASQDLVLLIQDEDECLSAVLDRHIAFFNSPMAYSHPGLAPIDPNEVAMVKPVVAELAKVLLYLNLSETEQRRVGERDELEQRLRGLGQKKAARIKRRLATAYNRILIGPSALPHTAAVIPAEHASGDTVRSLRPHWRRGHFRHIRHGEGLADSRLGWIRPVLVNAAEAFGPVRVKPYVMR